MEVKDGANTEKIAHDIWLRHEPYIRKICEYKLQSIPDRIDDCVQEAFTALIEALNKGIEIKNYKAWLTVVVNNIIKDIYSEAQKEKKNIVAFTSQNVDNIYSLNTDENKLFEINDEQLLLLKDKVVMSLNEDERCLLTDRYTLKKSIKQIAKENNTTENNIYQKLFRLKRKTKMIIDKILYGQNE